MYSALRYPEHHPNAILSTSIACYAQVHHDLKSANVLLMTSSDGTTLTAKLSDFGLADFNRTLATTTGMTTMVPGAGTACYEAPEQFDNEFTPASEVYSFAIVLWELLHGGRPWDGQNIRRIALAVGRGERPLVTAPPSLLSRTMAQCWAQEPMERPTFAALSRRLVAASRTFATSQYKALYVQQAAAPALQYRELINSVYSLVSECAQREGISAADARDFFSVLQARAVKASAFGNVDENAVGELLTQPHIIALRMYTSAETLPPVQCAGLEWLRVGTATPSAGRELVNAALSVALATAPAEGDVVMLTREQWEECHVTEQLHEHRYVEAGGHFFVPNDPQPTGNEKEFCSVLNHSIMNDYATHAVPFVFLLNKYLITQISRKSPSKTGSAARWPADNCVYRGGRLPPEHHHFFQVGKKYRAPMLLATSEDRSVAESFMADRGAPDYVLWIIRFHPSRQCDHVNFVNKNDGSLGTDTPNEAAESEWLFSPYATFTVSKVTFQTPGPNAANPHVVELVASVNNKCEKEDLPSCPWC